MGIAGLEGLPEEKRTQKQTAMCVHSIGDCTYIPSKGFIVVCGLVDPKILLTVILAV